MKISSIRTGLTIIFVSLAVAAFGQNSSQDLQLIEECEFEAASHLHHDHDDTEYANNKDQIKLKSRSWLIRYNPLTLTLVGSMWVYQNFISPQLNSSCIYETSCSNFSKYCIHEFGLVKGIALSADRITRCNRLGALDLHPLDQNPQTGRYHDEPFRYKLHP